LFKLLQPELKKDPVLFLCWLRNIITTMSTPKKTQENIVNFLKNYGFVFASSEIYGGLANT
jgi:hypothetical protein